jgi:hypothetical protein
LLGVAAISLALGCASAPAAAQTSGTATAETTGKATVKPAAKAPSAAKATAAKPAARSPAKSPAKAAPKPVDELAPGQRVSNTVIDLAAWVIATGDNRGMPFAIVDKRAAQLLVFGKDGKLAGLAPVLVGSAEGDTSAEGVGDRELKDIPMEERTTPAGRYLAGFGPAAKGKTVLWVDFATAVSIHPLESTAATKKEKRKERLASATPKDNRITHGCINVSPAFFTKVVRPVFKDDGVFYILPDTVSVRTAFPAFDQPSHHAIRDEG